MIKEMILGASCTIIGAFLSALTNLSLNYLKMSWEEENHFLRKKEDIFIEAQSIILDILYKDKQYIRENKY